MRCSSDGRSERDGGSKLSRARERRTAEERLAALAKEYFETYLSLEPLFATAIGDRRHDNRLPDYSPQGLRARERWLEDVVARASAIPEEDLSEADGVTRSALIEDAHGDLLLLSCRLREWTVDPVSGPQVSLLNVESYQPVRTVAEGRAMVDRWRAMGSFVDTHVGNLRRGLAAGKVAVRAGVEKAVDALESLLAKPAEEWPLLRPLKAPHEDWTEAESGEFHEGLARAVAASVRPAFERYRDLLRGEILPTSRPTERPGIMHVPDGENAYRKLIRKYSSLDLSAEELHETGMREVERINREMQALGETVFGTPQRTEVLRQLRTDPTLYFTTRDEVEAKARSAVARAKAAIPNWFGRLPEADCEVARIGEHEERHSTIAYYRWPAVDGSRPGQYYVNTFAPETRPRYEAEALAYHEAIPGHHLQIGLAQELTDIPEFRRHWGVTAFREGWGLYAERLSNEMGLYSSDLDRIGMLSYDAWRACRFVVDTGMHAKGWSRQQAIDFMLENTALAENNITNEVDRYIAWPGQALAYKTGQLEILRLREEVRRRLGPRFDIRAFHDALLENGAVDLMTLRALIERFVRRAA